jgi:arginyl-tRNA synthetase
MSIKSRLQNTIKNSLPIEIDVDKIIIDVPKDKKNGDYSTNVAFLLTKELKSNPVNIANDIKDRISDGMIERVEVANPGFINFYLSREFLLSNINVILEEVKTMVRVLMVITRRLILSMLALILLVLFILDMVEERYMETL